MRGALDICRLAVDEVVALRADVGAQLVDEVRGARFLDESDVHRRGRAVGNDRPRARADVGTDQTAHVERREQQRLLQPRKAFDGAARPNVVSISAESSGTAPSIASSSSGSPLDAVVETGNEHSPSSPFIVASKRCQSLGRVRTQLP